MTRGRREDLAALLASIEDALEWDFDRQKFSDRLRIQKYVLFSDAFGVDIPYEYGIHLYGPYSPTLAEDYYHENFEVHREIESRNNSLEANKFADLLEGRDTDWLEYAATIKRLHEKMAETGPGSDQKEPDKLTDVIERTCDLKNIDPATVDNIYDELLQHDVLQ